MLNVLIVEDDPMVTQINERFLNKVKGYALHKSVNSLDKAKEIISKNSIDLILLDVFFPNGRGIDLLKWIRHKNFKCDVILITADKNIETVEEAFRYGAIDYIIKPFKYRRFEEALNQYKVRKNTFKNFSNSEQEVIDKFTLNAGDVDDKRSDMGECKGISEQTYNLLMDVIKSLNDRAFTAQDIAELTGFSRITARRYLDYLEQEEKVVLELEYGSVGRPKNKYRLIKDDE
jgi:response regulator of citrate/malate metabolism